MGEGFPIISSLLASAAEGGEGGGHHGPSFWGVVAYLVFVLITLFVLMAYAKKGINNRVFKNPITACFEQLYLFIQNMVVGIIGPHGRKYVPMMMVFWMVIFTSNFVALFFPTAPTADIGFNLGMALIAIGYVQWEGMSGHYAHLRHEGKDPFTAAILGFGRHFSHFAGPKLGIAMIPITLMIFVIELISEVMKNVSLTLRLYGNIHGGHMAVDAMNALGKDIYVPVGAFLLPIKLLTCVVQALIFTLLTSVYISLVTHHEDDHGKEHGHEGEPAHAH